jgi:hypothetical protein
MVWFGEKFNRLMLKHDLLDAATDTVLSEEIAKRDPLPGSKEDKRIHAKGSKRMREHLEKVAKAKFEANMARVQFDAYKAGMDNLRTVAATQREEMKRMPGMV